MFARYFEVIQHLHVSKQPFNAFLSGFAATVGQFVLTASLRIQTNPENKADFGTISHERYADGPKGIHTYDALLTGLIQGFCRLCLWQSDPPLLLRQLHQLERLSSYPLRRLPRVSNQKLPIFIQEQQEIYLQI